MLVKIFSPAMLPAQYIMAKPTGFQCSPMLECFTTEKIFLRNSVVKPPEEALKKPAREIKNKIK
ncbi:MAG: hypothetical protein ABIH42_01570 [Planctomycetota bacterium]